MLDELGLLPLVKKLQFQDGHFGGPWVMPEIFDSHSLRHLSALTNLRNLTIDNLDLSKSKMGLEEYFGHFSPTLRSVSLNRPSGPPRRLLDFLTLFSELDDIEIIHHRAMDEVHTTPEILRSPIQGSLRGKLTLRDFVAEGLLRDIITAFGRTRDPVRFHGPGRHAGDAAPFGCLC